MSRERPDYLHWTFRLGFRSVGGVLGFLGMLYDAKVAASGQIAQVCAKAIELGNSIQDSVSMTDYNNLSFRCVTGEGAPDPVVAVVGGSIAGAMVLAESIFNQPEDDGYSRYWAAWHLAQGVCAVATPAVIDILIKRFSVAPMLQENLHRPEVLVMTGLQVGILALGSMRLLGSTRNLFRLGGEQLQENRVKDIENRHRRLAEARSQQVEKVVVVPRRSAMRGMGRVLQRIQTESTPSSLTEEMIEKVAEQATKETTGHFRQIKGFFAYQRFARLTRRVNSKFVRV